MSPPRLHTRHLTWPPNIHLLPKSMNKSPTLNTYSSYTKPLPALNEEDDPFAHFLSPVLEEESDYNCDSTSYTAGITPYTPGPSSANKDALFRARLEEKWETYVARRLLAHSKSKPGSTSIPAPLPPPFPQAAPGTPPGTPPGEDTLPDLVDEDTDTDTDMDATSPAPSTSPQQMQWYFPSTMSSHDSTCDFIDDEDTDMSYSSPSSDDEELDGWASDRRNALCLKLNPLGSNPRHEQPDSRDERGRSRAVKIVRPRMKFGSKRTLSGKKHSWREPSWDLWTVDEEVEEEVVAEDKGRVGKKRRVHWNEEVIIREFER